MTNSDVERRLTALLHQKAEEAMKQTDTLTELDRFQARVEEDDRRYSRRGAVAGLTAAAAVIAAGAIWLSPIGDSRDDAGPADGSEQTAEERVAQQFVDAFVARDNERAVSYVADDATMPADWQDHSLAVAYGVEHILQPCETKEVSDKGTRIECPFEYHARGSEQLGMEPFGGNEFTLVVDDGKVTYFEAVYDHQVNGEAELREDIGRWVRANYPGEWRFLDPDSEPEQKARWIRLWQTRIPQYVEAERAEQAE